MSKPDKEQVIAKFMAAYKAANGKVPEIEAKGGWYSIDGGKNIRLSQLDAMADELVPGEVKKETIAEAPAAPKQAKSEPKPAKKAQPATAGFSVKSFWIEQLDKEKPGSTAPR